MSVSIPNLLDIVLYLFVITVSQYRVKATEDKYFTCRGMRYPTSDLDTLKVPWEKLTIVRKQIRRHL